MKKLRTKVLGPAPHTSIDTDRVLTSTSLNANFFGHAGFPLSTDSLAYEPIQRLLAVRTCRRAKIPAVTELSIIICGHFSGKYDF